MTRRTKIVATLGPSSESPEVLRQMVAAGLDVARLGLAHGTPEIHIRRMRDVRRVAAEAGRPVAVLADLPGPKVRVAPFPDGGVLLFEGDEIDLAPGAEASSAKRIEIDYDGLHADLEVGDLITLGDGTSSVRVVEAGPRSMRGLVTNGGRLIGRPGAHLPASRVKVTSPTPEDLVLLDHVVAAGVDYVAVSFVRTADDVATVRAAIPPGGPLVVAKIETDTAVDNLDAILGVADAVMVARGDLGIDCAIEDVPHLQKHIIRTCIEAGRPVITATQMLESMLTSPVPTRAEVSDVANAVFDGSDALMLSGETAIGEHPAQVVATMARIAERAEREADYLQWGGRLGRLQRTTPVPQASAITAALTHAAWRAAVELGAKAIVCCTRSGFTARAMARFRPPCELVGLSPDPSVVAQLALSWGVRPLLVDTQHTIDDLVWIAVERVVAEGFAERDDLIVVLAGRPDDTDPASDVLRIVRVH